MIKQLPTVCAEIVYTSHISPTPDLISVRNIWGTRVLVPRHQNSGAPTFLFLVFLEVYARPCWQCSD